MQARAHSRGGRELRMGWPVAKELRTAQQLSDVIVAALGVSEVTVRYSRRSCFRVATDGDFVSRRFDCEEIANRLRLLFDLRK